MKRSFATKIKRIQYDVYKAVVKYAYEDRLIDLYREAPTQILPGPKAELRCCIFMERAILAERINLALGGNPNNPNHIETINIACDECPIDGITISSNCRSCLSHGCKHSCPKKAISIINRRAVVDKDLCIECGKCVSACPFGAITHHHRPCMTACDMHAISLGVEQKATIDNNKCVQCGKCIVKCPFGAIGNKSKLLEVINLIRSDAHVYAIYAPSIAGQFPYATLGQLVTGMRRLGFYEAVEVARGADMVLAQESRELDERGLLLSSCCPAFVEFVKKSIPSLADNISTTDSPMTMLARYIHNRDDKAKVVFISPCTAKYAEAEKSGCVDSVLAIDELQAYLDARDIDISELESNPIDDATYYGRIFSRSGGLSEGIKQFAQSSVRACTMSGLKECFAELMRLKAGKATDNFFEGMACDGGCVYGALNNWHTPRSKALNTDYADEKKPGLSR